MALFCSSCAITLLFLCLVLALQEILALPADENALFLKQVPELLESLCRGCNGKDVCNYKGNSSCMSQHHCNLLHGVFYDCSQYRNRCSSLTEFCTENYHCCEPSKNKCSKKNQCCKRIKAKCFDNYECCSSACYNQECCKPVGARCRFNDQCCTQNCDQSVGADFGLCSQSAIPYPTCAGVGEHCSMDTPCCDTESRCSKKNSTCCRKNGAFCHLGGHCCGNNVCYDGKCCKTQNMKCSRNDQCCSGYYCSNNAFGKKGFCTVYRSHHNLSMYPNHFRQLQLLTDKEIVAAADEGCRGYNDETSL